MKTVISFSTAQPQQLKLLLEVAAEMGMETEQIAQQLSEPLEPYKASDAAMKTAFFASASSRKKIDVLKKVAAEMGIQLLPLTNEQAEDMLLAQDSMLKEWAAPENNHWDAFLRSHKID
jgi:predicted DsbA family dithiol-disulfide isomerase